eukprot:TRINITY_DN669_c0_g2_i1.p1 TRINITY_DN669_c0_g2~~TRINITY_DN669_c0_g2_i1.p1  ORF type:complete len:394 (-),score=104.66 TRINITY_DN669_c0_g2_i1:165-1346(-)
MDVVVFYFLQGELGEDVVHPNGYILNFKTSNPQPCLKDILRTFPLRDNGRFHYRFRTMLQNKHVYIDITNPEEKLPMKSGVIFMKVLRIKDKEVKIPLYRPKEPVAASFIPSDNTLHASVVDNIQKMKLNMSKTPAQPITHGFSAPATPITITPPNESVAGTSHDDIDIMFGSPQHKVQQPKLTARQLAAQRRRNHNSSITGLGSTSPRIGNGFKPVTSVRSQAQTQMKNNSQTNNTNNTQTTTTTTTKAPSAAEVQEAIRERQRKTEQHIQDRVDEVRRRDEREAEQEEERHQAHLELGDKVTAWEMESGQRRNLRTLLATLHTVLWEGATWKPCSISTLLSPSQVRRKYLRALPVVHPDKNSGKETNRKFIAERAFEALNAAWKDFQEKEL